MAVPWLAIGKLVLTNLDTIIGVVKPGFTRKKIETPSQTDLLNQQIAELQAAASGNAEQIKQLAGQIRQIVTSVDEAAVAAASERRLLRTLCVAAMAISVVSLVAAIAAIVGR